MAPMRVPSDSLSIVLTALLIVTTISFVGADFHVMNVHNYNGGQAIFLVPSNNYGCNGIQSSAIAGTQYPDCSAGYLHVPDGQCGWSGVTIKPACTGNYFGKLYGNSGEAEGDCYWNDSGSTSSFTCNDGLVFDRLVCYSSMCGAASSGHLAVYR